jgi:hypothetical protein
MSKIAKTTWGAVLTVAAILILVAAACAQQPAPRGPGAGAAARANFVTGNVAEIDVANNLIGVNTQNNGEVWVAVSTTTQILRSTQVTAADLALGQTLTVRGTPTAITATNVGIGDLPNLAPQRGVQGLQGGGALPAAGAAGPAPTTPAAGAAAGGAAGGAPAAGGAVAARLAQARASSATITGKVTNLNPLTITTPEGGEVLVTLAADANVLETAPVALADVKADEQVTVMAQHNADGTYAARFVMLGDPGLLASMLGRGGFGGAGARAPRANRGNAAGAGQAAPAVAAPAAAGAQA